jgi:hypothetical protein
VFHPGARRPDKEIESNKVVPSDTWKDMDANSLIALCTYIDNIYILSAVTAETGELMVFTLVVQELSFTQFNFIAAVPFRKFVWSNSIVPAAGADHPDNESNKSTRVNGFDQFCGNADLVTIGITH